MGTSGAFGGSKTQPWQDVAELIGGAAGPAPSASQEEGGENSEQDPTTSGVAPLVAEALQSDDPSTKPRYAPAATVGDSGLSFGKLTGNARRTGTLRPGPAGGRREITSSTGKAGRALGAAFAVGTGNAALLNQYGLDLSSLRSLGRVEQILAIMDAVGVGNAGPDDIALRASLVEVLDRALDTLSTPEETMIEFVAKYATNLFSIEIDALIQNGKVDPNMREKYLIELGEVIRIDAGTLDVTGALLTTPSQFEHAAQQLMRGTLHLVATRNKR